MLLLASAAGWVLLEAGLGLALLLGILWWLGQRNFGPRAGAQRVLRLTAQDAVHIVELEGRRLLLSTGSSGPARLICELDAVRPDASSSGAESPGGDPSDV